MYFKEKRKEKNSQTKTKPKQKKKKIGVRFLHTVVGQGGLREPKIIQVFASLLACSLETTDKLLLIKTQCMLTARHS